MTLQYEPIGRVKLSRTQKWKKRANDLLALLKVASVSMFVLGMICGAFIGFYI